MTTEHQDDQRRGGFREAVNELFGRSERGDTHEPDQLSDRDRAEAARRQGVGDAEAATPRHAYGEQAGAGYDDVQQSAPDGYGAGDASGEGPPTAGRYDDAGAGNRPGADLGAPTPGRPGAAEEYGGTPQSAPAEHLHQGGDPTAQGQVHHGGEVRGDPGVPGERVHQGGDPTAHGQIQHGGEVRGDPGVPAVQAGAPSDTTATAATGAGAAGTAQHDPTRHDTATGGNENGGQRAALVTRDRAESYGTRWDSVKGAFVDEPRRAVADADALVGELLDELQGLFKQQRSEIEHSLDRDETSTEDLRLALRRYRSFFDRLLSI